jgi:uncharacterized protein
MSLNVLRYAACSGLVATLVMAAGLPAAHAAEPSSPTSPAKKALVQKLLQLQQPGIEGMARALVEQAVAPMMQQAQALVQARVPADRREQIAKDIQGDLKKYGESTGPMVVARAVALAPSTVGTQLDEKFSEDELKQLVAWLDSPLSRKYQQSLPDLQRALTDKLIAETRPTVEPKLRELNDAVTRRITAQAGQSGPGAPMSPAKP